MTNLSISRADEADAIVLAVAGELDLSNHSLLRDQIHGLLRVGTTELVVDLTATTFIDSIALGTLIGARRRAYGLGASLSVVLGNPIVARVFDITGLHRVFTTYRDIGAWRAATGPNRVGT